MHIVYNYVYTCACMSIQIMHVTSRNYLMDDAHQHQGSVQAMLARALLQLLFPQIIFLSPRHVPMEIATFLAHQFLQENLYPHPISTHIVPSSPPEASAFCGSWGTGCSTAFAENRRSSRFQTSSRSPKREGWVIDGSVFSDKQIFLHFFTII